MNAGAASDRGKVSDITNQADHVEILLEFPGDTSHIKTYFEPFCKKFHKAKLPW
jgi:hypothetical protein